MIMEMSSNFPTITTLSVVNSVCASRGFLRVLSFSEFYSIKTHDPTATTIHMPQFTFVHLISYISWGG